MRITSVACTSRPEAPQVGGEVADVRGMGRFDHRLRKLLGYLDDAEVDLEELARLAADHPSIERRLLDLAQDRLERPVPIKEAVIYLGASAVEHEVRRLARRLPPEGMPFDRRRPLTPAPRFSAGATDPSHRSKS